MKNKLIIMLAVVLGGFLAFNFLIAPSVNASADRLENDLVCMVNNAYMGKKQIPVPVGDKIYYGCCEMCKDKLRNGEAFRYAKDPYSGEKVDKATAFIVRKSENTDEVFYFASKENFISYKSTD